MKFAGKKAEPWLGVKGALVRNFKVAEGGIAAPALVSLSLGVYWDYTHTHLEGLNALFSSRT